ncbi:MAG: YtxH domain-containing protein [Cytophagales bacterium]|nr:YtxH domain-containing protein [Cytophagales bacterium]MDW8384184.1 YtxH domain-containing protein [Flammeovirgaceae bacterium]
MSKRSTALVSFLLGAATGAILGVLFAPDKGKSTRDKLSYQLDKYKQLLQETIEGLISGKTEAVTAARSEGKKVVNDTIRQAEGLMGEIDALRSKISSKKS